MHSLNVAVPLFLLCMQRMVKADQGMTAQGPVITPLQGQYNGNPVGCGSVANKISIDGNKPVLKDGPDSAKTANEMATDCLKEQTTKYKEALQAANATMTTYMANASANKRPRQQQPCTYTFNPKEMACETKELLAAYITTPIWHFVIHSNILEVFKREELVKLVEMFPFTYIRAKMQRFCMTAFAKSDAEITTTMHGMVKDFIGKPKTLGGCCRSRPQCGAAKKCLLSGGLSSDGYSQCAKDQPCMPRIISGMAPIMFEGEQESPKGEKGKGSDSGNKKKRRREAASG